METTIEYETESDSGSDSGSDEPQPKSPPPSRRRQIRCFGRRCCVQFGECLRDMCVAGMILYWLFDTEAKKWSWEGVYGVANNSLT